MRLLMSARRICTGPAIDHTNVAPTFPPSVVPHHDDDAPDNGASAGTFLGGTATHTIGNRSLLALPLSIILAATTYEASKIVTAVILDHPILTVRPLTPEAILPDGRLEATRTVLAPFPPPRSQAEAERDYQHELLIRTAGKAFCWSTVYYADELFRCSTEDETRIKELIRARVTDEETVAYLDFRASVGSEAFLSRPDRIAAIQRVIATLLEHDSAISGDTIRDTVHHRLNFWHKYHPTDDCEPW